MELRENERIDELGRRGYRILQKKEGFRFGMDAVLLSWFAQVREGERVIDLGTGTGIIPILMDARNNCGTYIGLELQKEMAELASRSVRLNQIEDHMRIEEGDIRTASVRFGRGSFQVVTSNPPYMNDANGLINENRSLAIARHEILCNLDDVAAAAGHILKTGGRFYMIHRPHRLAEIFECLRAHRLEPKRMQLVHPHIGDNANMVLIEARKNEGAFLKVEKPIIVYS